MGIENLLHKSKIVTRSSHKTWIFKAFNDIKAYSCICMQLKELASNNYYKIGVGKVFLNEKDVAPFYSYIACFIDWKPHGNGIRAVTGDDYKDIGELIGYALDHKLLDLICEKVEDVKLSAVDYSKKEENKKKLFVICSRISFEDLINPNLLVNYFTMPKLQRYYDTQQKALNGMLPV
jgi:hypothetical protein